MKVQQVWEQSVVSAAMYLLKGVVRCLLEAEQAGQRSVVAEARSTL